MKHSSDANAHDSINVMDMANPVTGVGGVMYRLIHHRTREVDAAFVYDADDSELVAAPDVYMLSGAKGGALWLVIMIVLVDVVILADIPGLFSSNLEMFSSIVVTLLFLVLSVFFLRGYGS